jgi:hypothetical protein
MSSTKFVVDWTLERDAGNHQISISQPGSPAKRLHRKDTKSRPRDPSKQGLPSEAVDMGSQAKLGVLAECAPFSPVPHATCSPLEFVRATFPAPLQTWCLTRVHGV